MTSSTLSPIVEPAHHMFNTRDMFARSSAVVMRGDNNMETIFPVRYWARVPGDAVKFMWVMATADEIPSTWLVPDQEVELDAQGWAQVKSRSGDDLTIGFLDPYKIQIRPAYMHGLIQQALEREQAQAAQIDDMIRLTFNTSELIELADLVELTTTNNSRYDVHFFERLHSAWRLTSEEEVGAAEIWDVPDQEVLLLAGGTVEVKSNKGETCFLHLYSKQTFTSVSVKEARLAREGQNTRIVLEDGPELHR